MVDHFCDPVSGAVLLHVKVTDHFRLLAKKALAFFRNSFFFQVRYALFQRAQFGILLMEISTAHKWFCRMPLKAGHPCIQGIYIEPKLPCNLCR